jgi:hypothetical protein
MKFTPNNNNWPITVFFLIHYITLLSIIIFPVYVSIQQDNYWWLLMWLFMGLLPKFEK